MEQLTTSGIQFQCNRHFHPPGCNHSPIRITISGTAHPAFILYPPLQVESAEGCG